jgi:hypothetical protein
MTEPSIPVDGDTARPLQLRRRVKRGIVASYIHELSVRHDGVSAREIEPVADAVEPVDEG